MSQRDDDEKTGGASAPPEHGAPRDDEDVRAATAKASEMEDRWLRTAAELDNFRRRAARDREQAVARASDAELLVVVRVIDDLERALAAARSETATAESLRQGLVLVTEQARAALRERGVETIDPVNEPFDPTMHEAVLRNPEGPPNVITRVVAPGYRRAGHVLRPAQVEVGG